MYSHLFEPFEVGGLKLRNRITMAPLYLGYAGEGGSVSNLLLERAIILSRGRSLGLKFLGFPGEEDRLFVQASASEIKGYDDIIQDTKRSLIEDALKRAGGKRHEAARLLGLTRDALKRQMTTLGFGGQKDP